MFKGKISLTLIAGTYTHFAIEFNLSSTAHQIDGSPRTIPPSFG